MVDIGRNDGAPARHFIAHEFRRYLKRQVGPKAVACMLAGQHVGHALAPFAAGGQRFHIGVSVLVLANGDIFHFRRDQAAPRIMHLRNVLAVFGAPRLPCQIKPQSGQLFIGQARLPIGRAGPVHQFGIIALLNPCLPQRGQALTNVNRHIRIGIGPGCVIDINWRVFFACLTRQRHIGGRIMLCDFAHRYANIGPRAGDIDFFTHRQRCNGRIINARRIARKCRRGFGFRCLRHGGPFQRQSGLTASYGLEGRVFIRHSLRRHDP